MSRTQALRVLKWDICRMQRRHVSRGLVSVLMLLASTSMIQPSWADPPGEKDDASRPPAFPRSPGLPALPFPVEEPEPPKFGHPVPQFDAAKSNKPMRLDRGERLEHLRNRLDAFEQETGKTRGEDPWGTTQKQLHQIIEEHRATGSRPAKREIEFVLALVSALPIKETNAKGIGARRRLLSLLNESARTTPPATELTETERQHWLALRSCIKRVLAADREYEAGRALHMGGKIMIDLVLDAQRRRGEAELEMAREVQVCISGMELGEKVMEALTEVVAHVELKVLEDARDDALETWGFVHEKWKMGVGTMQEECQTREQLHALDAKIHMAKARLAGLANEKSGAGSPSLSE